MSANWRVVKLKDAPKSRFVIFRVIAVLLGLLVAGIALGLSGYNPTEMLVNAVVMMLGTSFGIQDLGTLLTPLLLTGLAAMIAMRVNLWNIGGEGQFYMGAWAAAGVGIYFDGPPVIALALMFVAGAIAGAVWIALPAYARSKANIDEIITTLLMNFLALYWIGYFAAGPWSDPGVRASASSYKIQYELMEWFGFWNIGVFIALALIAMCWVLFNKTVWGYETAYVGSNPNSSSYAGIPAQRRILVTMLLSGAIAGVAGVIEVSGTVNRLQLGISNYYGFMGVVIAALAAGSYMGVIIASVLIAILLNTGIVFEIQGLSLNAVVALTGWILLVVGIAQVAANYKLVRVQSEIVGQ